MISSTSNIAGPYTLSTGGGEVLPITFFWYEASHIEVYVDGALVSSDSYSLSGAGTETSTMTVVSGTAGEVWTIRRVMPKTQLNDYVEGDEFPPETHERALDYLAMTDQELDERIDRAITVGIGDPAPVVSAAATRAGKTMAFDSSGDYTELSSAQLLARLNLEIPTGIVDRPTTVFAETALIASAIPDFEGQVGIDLEVHDTDPLSSIYISTGLSAGNWVQADTRVTTNETDIVRGELWNKGGLLNKSTLRGIGGALGSGTPEISAKSKILGSETGGGVDTAAFGNISYHPALRRLTVTAYKGTDHVDNSSYGVLTYSDDGGVTWPAEATVISNPAAANTQVRDINHCVLQDGRMMLAWTEASNVGSTRNAWWAKVKFSDDGGATWGSETTLESRTGTENVIFAGEPSQMRDGTIIVPAYHHPSGLSSDPYENKFFYSTDNGVTWSTRDIVSNSFAADCSETKIVELADGTWAAFYRRQVGGSKMLKRTSTDAGVTWSSESDVTPTPSASTYRYCRPDVCLLSTGTMLLFYRTAGNDTHFAASYDDGDTWSTSTAITHQTQYDYGGFVEVDRGYAIGIAFSENLAGNYGAGYMHRIYDGAVSDSNGIRVKGGNIISYGQAGLPIVSGADRPTPASNYPAVFSEEAKCIEVWNGQFWEAQASADVPTSADFTLFADYPVEALAAGSVATLDNDEGTAGLDMTGAPGASEPAITVEQMRGAPALVFDGTNDFSNPIANWDFLHDGTTDWSLFVPFYVGEANPDKFMGLFTTILSLASGTPNVGFLLYIDNRTSVPVEMCLMAAIDGAAAGSFSPRVQTQAVQPVSPYFSIENNISPQTWHCAGVTYEALTATQGTLSLYVDGTLQGADTATATRNTPANADAHIGSFNAATGFFTGSIGRVMCYKNLMSASDVLRISTALLR